MHRENGKNIFCSPKKFEEVPREYALPNPGKAFWLPLFAVPQKDKARIVFDAAAKYNGRSLNDFLLPGPDRNNALRAVLLRYRRYRTAFAADVENMFHQFLCRSKKVLSCDSSGLKTMIQIRN